MKTNYLLPNKYKPLGWFLLIIGLLIGLFLVVTDYESEYLNIQVFTIFNSDSGFGNNDGLFQIIENSIVDEIASISIILGGLLIGFSKEKIEDEFIYSLRKDSLVWALIINYIILLLAIMLVYGFTFFDILVFNMFTPLLFFIFRFNFLKHKTRSHEE